MQPDKMHVLALCNLTQILYDYNHFAYKHRAFHTWISLSLEISNDS